MKGSPKWGAFLVYKAVSYFPVSYSSLFKGLINHILKEFMIVPAPVRLYIGIKYNNQFFFRVNKVV
jgi:hypothetical protein